MAAARDQVARHLRAEPDVAEAGFAREVVADAPRSPTAEETPRRPAEMPGSPAAEKPAPAIKPAIAPPAMRSRRMLGTYPLGRSRSPAAMDT